jgi:uncharacterized RDD family membrane protein YckC
MYSDKSLENVAVAENTTSLLDEHIFVPIDLNWRKKYYRTSLIRRGKALFIDLFYSFFPTLFISFIIFTLVEVDMDKDIGVLCFFISFYIILVFYSAYMESSHYRGTFGKVLMKIQITNKDGYPISFHRALWRNLLRVGVFYSYFLILPLIIQAITFIITKKLFHDQLTSTIIGDIAPGRDNRILGTNVKSEKWLNKKTIFLLSLFGIITGVGNLFGELSNLLLLIYLVIFIFIAYIIAKKGVGKYVRNAFLVVFLCTVWEVLVFNIFFSTYLSNNTMDEFLIKTKSSPRLTFLLNGLVGTFFAALLLAYLAFLISGRMKKNKS